MRLAGVVLLLGAALGVVAKLEMPETEGLLSHVQTAILVVDFLLGAGLVFGQEALKSWAVLRAVLGGIGFSIYLVLQQTPFLAALEGAYSLGLLLLLAGAPGAARTALGAATSGGSLAVAGLILFGTLSGNNPLGRLALWGQIEWSPARTVEGVAARYRLTLPNDRWHLVRAEVMRKEALPPDRWLVRPDRDAHIRIVAIQMPTRGQVVQVSAAQLNEGFVEGLRRGGTGLQVLEAGSVTAGSRVAPLAHVRCTVQGVELEWYVTSFVQGPHLFQLAAAARPKAFPGVKGEILQTFSSFAFP